MPNWCENTLVVTGKKDAVDSFYNKCYINGDFKMLEAFLPTPVELMETTVDLTTGEDIDLHADLKDLIVKYGTYDWYRWRVSNWGTKWEVAYPRLVNHLKEDNDIESLVISFDTAWDTPAAGLIAISEKEPDLMFYIDFLEPGMGFSGYLHVMNGKVISSQVVDVKPSVDSYLEDIVNNFEDAVNFSS